MNNKNKIKIIASLIAMLGAGNSIAQNNVTGNFDTTATIESFCSINAGDINFGVVALPLTAQSANAQMNVLCSNNTPYTVDLSYGGNFVDPTGSSSGYTVSMAYKYTDSYEKSQRYGLSGYRIYKDGQPIGNGIPNNNVSSNTTDFNLNGDMNFGDFYCNGMSVYQTKIYFRTQEAADLLYPGSQQGVYISDKKGICSSGSAGRVNMDNWNAFAATLGGSISDKGSMVGTFKGDQLAYQITLPNDSTKPWIAKVNSYTATGSGANQVIEMNAKIVPSASSSTYIAADTYLDTVIATVSY